MVVLEGDAAAVPAVAVSLDREALTRPEKIHRPASDTDVDPRLRHAVAATETRKSPSRWLHVG